MKMKFSAMSDIGRKRELNEDSYAVFEVGGMGFMIVADGMGGHNAGEVASSCAVEAIRNHICENAGMQVQELLKSSMQIANDFVFQKARSDASYSSMGTTVVVCCIKGKNAYFANIGDSRGYIISKGEIRQITCDDSVVSELVRLGEITAEQARVHPQRNVITKALGTEEAVDATLYRASCKKGDVILLCSDGLTELVDDDEIFNIISQSGIDEGVRLLSELANLRGGYDNITVTAVKIGEVDN